MVVLVVVGCLALGLRLRRSVCLRRRALLRARFAGCWRLCRLRGRCRPLFPLAGDLAFILTIHDVFSLSFFWAYHRRFKTGSGHVNAWKESKGKLTADVLTLNYRCLERHVFSSTLSVIHPDLCDKREKSARAVKRLSASFRDHHILAMRAVA